MVNPESSVDVYRPETLDEALQIRRTRDVIPLAGGTDLMVRYRNRRGALPSLERDILLLNHLNELKELRREGSFLRVGAGMNLTDLVESDAVPPLLREAVRQMSAPAIRNAATLGGNLGNASPAGDSLPPLAVLDARIELTSFDDRRVLPFMDFFLGPGKTQLTAHELITVVLIPDAPLTWYYYRKVGTRRANALSKLSIAAGARVVDGRLRNFRLALGAVGPRVVISSEAGQLMEGVEISSPDMKSKVSQMRNLYKSLIVPIDDQRSTAAYRKKVALNLIDDAISQLLCF